LARVRSALSSRRLRRIIGAYTVNRLGSWIGLVALSLAVFDHTHEALAVAALLLAWQALPAFLVPALVARVEAADRRGGLSALYALEAGATGGLALLLSHFSLAGVLVLALIDGTAAMAANALLRAEVARVARAEGSGGSTSGRQLNAADDGAHEAERSANAALNFAFSLSFVTGPVIGGLMVAGTGASAALLVDVGTFLVCAALLIDLRAHVQETAEDSVRARLRQAWSHIRTSRSLRSLLFVDAFALVFVQAGAPIEVALVKSTLHGGDRAYGFLVTAWGAGTVVASIAFARLGRRPLSVTLTAGVFALGVAFVGYAVAPSLPLAYLAAFVGGCGNGLDLPSLMSLVQRLTPQRLHGRMIGAVESLTALSLAAGLPLGGALVAASSPRAAFLALGIGTLLTSAAFVRLTLIGLEPMRDDAKPGAVAASEPVGTPGLLSHEPSPE
jgi:predicted MFS family arabinose efflux permease